MGLFAKKNKQKRPHVTAVIAAAGSSSRMGGGDKLFSLIAGTPVIALTLLAFEQCVDITDIVVAASSESIVPIGDICKEYGVTKAVTVLRGGETRAESVYKALLNAPPEAEFAAIHDGARPLVRPSLISEVVRCAVKHGAAMPIVPLKDTVKLMDGAAVISTPERGSLGAAQTPQVFELGLIKGALTKSMDVTDDAQAVERLGKRIQSVPGDEANIKITVPEDLLFAEALIASRAFT
ncbi:MAG: 2-C-methyl-D-erythritol 4-phosphate cytidylyltransferase [Oscillospiraceae bacterium]|nr:2-C-methyl-D-erythritol 4-phosphate cytidylyltransferase [Oscillospiraceae bacterium]